ncbi:Flp family type IVb pilin [Roseicella frigidaeris]|uniref:Flp family type IVb pilin n=1 Tax=Roseicella frigidaeris TaxID=2230885 RepID=UPI000F0BBC40|nr:Flp family type IVb pilin [Roseicella frigidaeris]
MVHRLFAAARSLTSREAVAATEYAVLATGIVIAILAALNAFGGGLHGLLRGLSRLG